MKIEPFTPTPETNKQPLPKLEDFAVDHFKTIGMTWQEVEDLRPPVIVEGFLRQGQVMLIGAESKSRKSWLSLDMGLCVAMGKPWLTDSDGRHGFQTTQANVWAFDLEMDRGETEFRFAKVRNNQIPDKAAREEVTERFKSFAMDGQATATIFNLIEQSADRVKPGDIVLVDCFYRLQADGNEAEEVASALQRLKTFAQDTQCGLVLVDHFRKAGAEKARDRFAGSFVKQASANTLVGIEVKEGILNMEIDARSFHGTPMVCAEFELSDYSFRAVPLAEVEKRKTGAKQAERESWIHQAWNSHFHETELTTKDLSDAWSVGPNAVPGRAKKLVEDGLMEVVKAGVGKKTTHKLTDSGKELRKAVT